MGEDMAIMVLRDRTDVGLVPLELRKTEMQHRMWRVALRVTDHKLGFAPIIFTESRTKEVLMFHGIISFAVPHAAQRQALSTRW